MMSTNRKVTIVMYHYVRDIQHSRFPAIKGLSLDRFHRQLDFLEAHYNPVTVEEVLAVARSKEDELPPNAVLLTFDDGYQDHFLNVFPLLDERKIQGCFFPPAQVVLERKVLEVNKIHFVLAAIQNPHQILERIFGLLAEFRAEYSLKSNASYLRELDGTHRYDLPEVTIIKQLLQRELPLPVRTEIIRQLFAEYVTADEAAFAGELYMSMDQIACLHRHGMHIGSHGFSHAWLNYLSPAEQAVEVDRSLDFLQKVGVAQDGWTMCYPYGGYNESLLQVLQERQCALGFSVETRVADLSVDPLLTLPRLDTNDLPS